MDSETKFNDQNHGIKFTRSLSNTSKNLQIKYKSMSTKKKIIIGARVLFIMICSIGLINQTVQLITQYQIGQTVVNINYENKNFNKLPGITVCYPAALSMARVSENYNFLKPLYEEYMRKVNDMTEDDHKDDIKGRVLSDVYAYNFTEFIQVGNIYRMGQVPIKKIFDMSIPYEKEQGGEPTIKIETWGIPLNGSCSGKPLSDDSPIESLVFKDKYGWKKCFTFFSHINPKWREYEMDINKIYLQIYFNHSWFPKKDLMDNGIQLSMHSPDELPRHDVEYYTELKPNRVIKLTYNRWKTQLLGEGYQTRCHNYDLNDSHYSGRMRSNCIKHCIQEEMFKCSDCRILKEPKSESCDFCLSLTSVLWTQQDFEDNPLIRVCENSIPGNSVKYLGKISCLQKMALKAESECLSNCRPKCVNRYFNYEVKSVSETETRGMNVTIVTIQHNQLPDQITKHLPEMTPIQFVSNFGGLLGMWLGLSALAIFKYVLKFCFN